MFNAASSCVAPPPPQCHFHNVVQGLNAAVNALCVVYMPHASFLCRSSKDRVSQPQHLPRAWFAMRSLPRRWRPPSHTILVLPAGRRRAAGDPVSARPHTRPTTVDVEKLERYGGRVSSISEQKRSAAANALEVYWFDAFRQPPGTGQCISTHKLTCMAWLLWLETRGNRTVVHASTCTGVGSVD